MLIVAVLLGVEAQILFHSASNQRVARTELLARPFVCSTRESIEGSEYS